MSDSAVCVTFLEQFNELTARVDASRQVEEKGDKSDDGGG
jgi:hypothetical protein